MSCAVGRVGPFGLPEGRKAQGLQTLGRNLEEDEMITESDFAFIIFPSGICQ